MKNFKFNIKNITKFIIIISIILNIFSINSILLFIIGIFGICITYKYKYQKFYKNPILIGFLLIYILTFNLFGLPINVKNIEVKTDLSSEIQIPNQIPINFAYSPSNSDVNQIEFDVKNKQIAEINLVYAVDGEIVCNLIPKSKGTTDIIFKSPEKEKTFKINVSDEEISAKKAREEAERKAREEAEQKAREEAERKAREEAEQKAREEAERKAREEAEQKAREEAEQKAREETEQKANERTVYITPTGERYHYISTCGGKNSYPIPMSQVGYRTGCKKCVY